MPEGPQVSPANNRCRMHFSQTAKGLWQIDVTAEYDTPELSAKAVEKALDEARRVAREKGLVLTDQK